MEARPGGTHAVFEWFTSQVLADNPLGDPAKRQITLVLPPGYEARGARRYPVLYALTGFTGRGTMMLNETAWQPSLLRRLDELYDAGMPHVILVLPDCFTRLGGSQYMNSTATGRYEDYLVQEIIPHVDQHYATLAARGARGVFGRSSGGYGALHLTLQHSDLFAAVACHSGDMGFDCCYQPDFPKAAGTLGQAGGVETWFHAFEAKPVKAQEDFTALNIVAMAACYSPDASQPLGLALPFDLQTCELDGDVWARWLIHDPLERVAARANALRSLRLLYFDCGSRDDFFLHFGARRLSRALHALDIPHQHEEFTGGHFNIAHRYDVSLPKLAAALQKGENSHD